MMSDPRNGGGGAAVTHRQRATAAQVVNKLVAVSMATGHRTISWQKMLFFWTHTNAHTYLMGTTDGGRPHCWIKTKCTCLNKNIFFRIRPWK